MFADPEQIVELELLAEPGKVVSYDLRKLCSALQIDDASRVVVETDGARRALVTVYPSNPLAQVRKVTRDDLVMDRHGYIVVGVHHNGRPAKRRLFDPSTGSAQRFTLFGTTGAGKSRALQLDLAAEKINGIVSWVADLKNGQSVPEARDNVDWFGTTPEEAILKLRAAVAVALSRMDRYQRWGRNAFLRNDPDPLLHVRIEEANRLLEKGAPYRAEATYLIKELGRTGRSVGVGVGLSAQAGHLEELGGSDTLRGMLKEGETTLLRWTSSMMKQLVGDGLLPPGVQLMPISKTLAPARLVSQFDGDFVDDGDAPGTQGTAYLLSGPSPTSMMRHFAIGSYSPLPGLDPEILALYGDGPVPTLEPESHAVAGAAYAARRDQAALAGLCAQVAWEATAGPQARADADAEAGDGEGPAPSDQPRLVKDRVLDALRASAGPMDAAAVLESVNGDGGKEVKLGSVRNALSQLTGDGKAERDGHGKYTAASAS